MDTTGLSHETRVPQLVATNIVLLVVATIVLALRFYTRHKISFYIGADDWCMLAAYIVGIAQWGLWYAYGELGNAQHIWDIKVENLSRFFQVLWLIQVMYPIGLGLVKCSVLALYLRLFPSDRFRIVILCSIVTIVCMTIALTLSVIVQCIPVTDSWNVFNPKCIDREVQQIASSVLSFVTDIIILLLPMKYLLALRVTLREKIQVIAVMSLGCVTCVASVMRFKYISNVSHSKDATWDGFNLSIWSSLEFYLAIITACAPAIKPFFIKYMKVARKKLGMKEKSRIRPRNSSSSGPEGSTPSNSSSDTNTSETKQTTVIDV
ncbi:hypothetical protein B0J14DRAFT_657554 [Halenospora varia]|nr:hypothetical protein B0J14DRAFT_657554 [Halenospora varia]